MATDFTPKQPSESFAICFDFTASLVSETISEVISIIATDLTTLEDVSETLLDATKQFNNTTQVYTWVQDGEDGHNYNISCKIKSSADSEYELDGILPVKELPSSVVPPGWEYQFRTDFPEFANSNPEVYTSSSIVFWYTVGIKMLNIERWGDLYNLGLELFVAHNITLSYSQKAAAARGNRSGNASKLIASNSVGDVSVSYDTSSISETSGGDWNLTTYGRRLLRLARIVGIGGAQL